jgi:hypothetical protein
MARTTISIPDELKAEMDALGESINWSATAAEAFRAEVERGKVRRARTEGKQMNAALKRLKMSKAKHEAEAQDRGHKDGSKWAMESANYGELKNLAQHWPAIESTETNNALGPPGVFQRMLKGDGVSRIDVDGFWTNLWKARDDSDEYSSEYWDGFVEGALEVFEKIDD